MGVLEKYSSYKDSGIEWIGDIPEHWNILPGFKVYKENKTKNTGMIEDRVLSLSYGKIIIKPIEKLVGLVPESFETYQVVNPDDIIIRCMDLQNDKTSLRTGIANDLGIITSAYLNLNVFNNVSSKYLHYYLHMLDIVKIIYKFGTGLRQNLSYLDFKRLPIIFPNKDEQIKIVNFLNEKTAQIDEAIKQKEELINLLKERRQVLIHKAVTQGLNSAVKMKDSGVEWIGKIPEHWILSQLKWISKRYAGGTPDKSILRYWENGTIPWIASGEVNQDIICKPTTYITVHAFQNSSARWITKHSLVVALAGQGKTKGMAAYLDMNTTGNQSLAAVVPNNKKVISKFLFYYLKAAYKELRDRKSVV